MLVDWIIEGKLCHGIMQITARLTRCGSDGCVRDVPRTAFLAVNYTDRYLDTVLIEKTQFQLLGATSLHIASKLEDVNYIGVEDLAMCADTVFTAAQVLKMEEKLLNTLNFTLSVPTGTILLC